MTIEQTHEAIAIKIDRIKRQQEALKQQLKQAKVQARARAKEERNKRIFQLGLVVD